MKIKCVGLIFLNVRYFIRISGCKKNFGTLVKENLNVCTNCGHHMGISPRDRFTALFDGGIFTEVAVPAPTADPCISATRRNIPTG